MPDRCVLEQILAAYSPLFQSNCFISWTILFFDDEQLTFYYCFEFIVYIVYFFNFSEDSYFIGSLV